MMNVDFLCRFRFGYDAVVWVLGASAWWQNEKEVMMLTLQSICKTITHDELHFSICSHKAGWQAPAAQDTYLLTQEPTAHGVLQQSDPWFAGFAVVDAQRCNQGSQHHDGLLNTTFKDFLH